MVTIGSVLGCVVQANLYLSLTLLNVLYLVSERLKSTLSFYLEPSYVIIS